MSYEVDVFAVGSESKSGDAIALRVGDFRRRDAHKVVVIDGGFAEDGEKLVRHIKEVYGTGRVDLVVSTHPDNDHSSGLRTVVEELEVARLWMHLPSRHNVGTGPFRGAGGLKKFYEQLEKSLATASELEKLARGRSVMIEEPFSGLQFGNELLVLGPSQAYYEELLSAFEETAPPEDVGFAKSLVEAVKGAVSRVREWWGTETLEEPADDATRPQNNSSVILAARLDTDWFLFSGDAGVPALDRALSSGIMSGLPKGFQYIQLPHHGSKRNIGPRILTTLLGPIIAEGATATRTAFVSAAKDGRPKHPSQRVLNAAIRRGAKVFVTGGNCHLYKSNDILTRPGWRDAVAESFVTTYDD